VIDSPGVRSARLEESAQVGQRGNRHLGLIPSLAQRRVGAVRAAWRSPRFFPAVPGIASASPGGPEPLGTIGSVRRVVVVLWPCPGRSAVV